MNALGITEPRWLRAYRAANRPQRSVARLTAAYLAGLSLAALTMALPPYAFETES